MHARLHAAARPAAGLAIGAGAAAIGFPPLNNAPDVLDIGRAPWRVVLTPVVLLALFALVTWVVWRPPQPRRPSGLLTLAITLLIAGTALSVTESPDPWYSILLGILCVLAPAALAFALLRGALPATAVAAGLVLATTVLCLRAGVVFVQLHGFPTAQALFNAKFQNAPYDFHYYTLGNPNGTAAFLLLPFGIAVGGATGGDLGRVGRRLALGAAGVLGATLVLAYSRSAIIVAVVMVLVIGLTASGRARAGNWARVAVGLVAAALVVGIAIGGWEYFSSLLSTAPGSSGDERIELTVDGLGRLAEHPLTGVGLGMNTPAAGYLPAHSSIVQAGAELGLLGLLGFLMLCAATIRLAALAIRAPDGWSGTERGSAVAAATYFCFSALTGGASIGLSSGYNAVWAATAAVTLGLAARHDSVPVRAGSRAARRRGLLSRRGRGEPSFDL